ncbi:MAG: zinc ABC transporter substrate-binding protein, partial [Anaerolinea sp.]|nr:zinc ABC transporter substrate-binding protein [Anaerolinea sp.]
MFCTFCAVLVLLLWLLPVGPIRADQARLTIVATTTQAADLSRILTADVPGIEVVALMGAGVDPHLYQPTEADIIAMSRADLIVYSGLRLEGQFDAVFRALSERGRRVFALGQPVKVAGFIVGGFTLGDAYIDVDDPHFWFDPRNWALAAQALGAELARLDPDYAGVYTANAEAYAADLEALFAWADAGMRSVALEQRYLVTSHDAFYYFSAAFGWRTAAVQGLSTRDEAGVGDIQAIVDFVRAHDVPVLFVESSIPPATIQAVIAAVNADGGAVRTGVRDLYSDAMGAPETFGGTYVGMFAQNVYTILQSYQCAGVPVTIPPWPEGLEPSPPPELLTVDCD